MPASGRLDQISGVCIDDPQRERAWSRAVDDPDHRRRRPRGDHDGVAVELHAARLDDPDIPRAVVQRDEGNAPLVSFVGAGEPLHRGELGVIDTRHQRDPWAEIDIGVCTRIDTHL